MWEYSSWHYEKNKVIQIAGSKFVPYREIDLLTLRWRLDHSPSRSAFPSHLRSHPRKSFSAFRSACAQVHCRLGHTNSGTAPVLGHWPDCKMAQKCNRGSFPFAMFRGRMTSFLSTGYFCECKFTGGEPAECSKGWEWLPALADWSNSDSAAIPAVGIREAERPPPANPWGLSLR